MAKKRKVGDWSGRVDELQSQLSDLRRRYRFHRVVARELLVELERVGVVSPATIRLAGLLTVADPDDPSRDYPRNSTSGCKVWEVSAEEETHAE